MAYISPSNLKSIAATEDKPAARASARSKLAAKVVQELEAEHRRELKKLSDIAFTFLGATDGDTTQAERMIDDFIDLLFEGGVLSVWRYRILLNGIREGL
jgi:hypothetical protein